MTGLNSNLYIGLSGIRSSQAGLSATGNNIANVNTPGYSRQRADTRVKGVITQQGLTLGTGSDVDRIEGLREIFAEKTVTRYEASQQFYKELADQLQDIEALMAESDETGVGFALSEFFAGIEKATQRPEDLTIREEVLALAQNLTAAINTRDADLSDIQNRTNLEVQDLVDEVNELTREIAALNTRISSVSKPSEDLIDQRRVAINKLSQLVGVDTYEMDNNQIQVNIKGSNLILVGKEIRNDLSVSPNAANNFRFDVVHNVRGNSRVITPDIQTGRLGGKLRLRDQDITDLRRQLDVMAAGLIVAFNTAHDNGTDLNGNTNLRFFDPNNTTVLGTVAVGTIDPDRYLGIAGTISLSSDLIDPLNTAAGFDPSRLAFSFGGAVGDNTIARQMADLRNATNVLDADLDGDPTNDGAVTYETYFGGLITGLGRSVRTADDNFSTQDALLFQAKQRRESISGVNLDEEAIQLTQYQQAFEASSRFISVINQLADDVLARLG